MRLHRPVLISIVAFITVICVHFFIVYVCFSPLGNKLFESRKAFCDILYYTSISRNSAWH
jgi:hypothetical protein